jgi:hypothetical protein
MKGEELMRENWPRMTRRDANREKRVLNHGMHGRNTHACFGFRVFRGHPLLALIFAFAGLGGFDAAGAGLGEPAAPAVYGIPWNADSLSNLDIGWHVDGVAIRFRAQHSGAVTQAKFFLVFAKIEPDHQGYASGTGGTVHVDLQADDGTPQHRPARQVLASAPTITDPFNQSPTDPVWGSHSNRGKHNAENCGASFRVVTFEKPAAVVAGQWYHLVFTNTDPDPVNNYVGLDNLRSANPTTPIQPGASDADLAILWKPHGQPWQLNPRNSPIFEVRWADGFKQGVGYIDVMASSRRAIAGAAQVREVITVSGGDRTVSRVAVHLRSTGKPGPLTVTLEEADGRAIARTAIPVSAVGGTENWAAAAFATKVVLRKNHTYHVVLSAPAGDAYEICPLQKGLSRGFSDATCFPDGYAQFADGNAWQGWREPKRKDFDLQLYFTTAP